ncbi:MAG: response regulator [Lachnospiraceae bacterium]|nr:response regulator [Lachnospiraceae bacterium]
MNQDIRKFAAYIVCEDTDDDMRKLYERGLNLSPLCICIKDNSGKKIYCNREYIRLFGEKVAERELCMSDMETLVLSDEQGKKTGTLEVTAVPEADNAVVSYFEGLEHTGIYIIDPETFTVLYENPVAQKYSVKNRIGQPCYSIHGNKGMCKNCPLRTQEHRSFVNRSDHDMIFSVEASPSWWREKPVYIITVRKQQDLNLHIKNEKILNRMLRVFQQTYGVYTEVNMQDGHYHQVNTGQLTYFSIPEEGTYKTAFEHMCSEEVLEEDVPEVKKILSWEVLSEIISDSEGLTEISVRYHLKKSCPMIIMESKAVFIRDELPHYVVIIAKDVTEETENLKNALEAAKQASNAKTSFLERMSHDIRTPMNAILGMTELSEGHFHEPDTMKENLHVIRDSSEQLMSIINDVLDMAKIESGAVFFTEESYNLKEELRSILAPYQVLAKKKQQHFIIEQGRIPSTYVIGDRAKFGRVLGNIIGNAIKFTPAGGHIEVIIRKLQSWNDAVMNLHFAVLDDGDSIPEEQIQKIFEPFYRGESANGHSIEGTGLGLAIAQNIVESRGGRIFAENLEQGGVSFSFDLPFRIDMEKRDDQEEEEDYFGENALDTLGMHILLAEDNEVNILVMKKILHAWGIIVEVAKNGKEAYETFTNSIDGMYSMILMDVRMPVMDGYDATRAIRASDHPQAQEIPIIALTANAFTEDISKSISARMDYHLSKPVDVKELKKMIRKFVHRREE